MAFQNVAGVLTGRGLMDCLQYYNNCLLNYRLVSHELNRTDSRDVYPLPHQLVPDVDYEKFWPRENI
jgi:hypothetical protein